jgi:hypothetical protein
MESRKLGVHTLAILIAGLLAAQAHAAPVATYGNDFNGTLNGAATGLNFDGWTVTGASSVVSTRGLPDGASTAAQAHVGSGFLGEFGGNDEVRLRLANLPTGVLSISIAFDLYLLRSWDGMSGGDTSAQYSGDDVFGFGYNDTHLLEASFSNGAQQQSYCPGWSQSSCAATFGSVGSLKNQLGFGFGIWTEADQRDWTAQSLVYQFPDFTMNAFQYEGENIDFSFFSRGLQIRQEALPDGYNDQGTPFAYVDESWGIDNLRITINQVADDLRIDATPVPEPASLALTLAGLAAVLASRTRRPGSTTGRA